MSRLAHAEGAPPIAARGPVAEAVCCAAWTLWGESSKGGAQRQSRVTNLIVREIHMRVYAYMYIYICMYI